MCQQYVTWQDHAANDTTGPGPGPEPGPVGWDQGEVNTTMSKMKPFVVGPKKHHDQVWVWKNLFSLIAIGYNNQYYIQLMAFLYVLVPPSPTYG